MTDCSYENYIILYVYSLEYCRLLIRYVIINSSLNSKQNADLSLFVSFLLFEQFYLSEEQLAPLKEAERNDDREKGAELLEQYVKHVPVRTRTFNQGEWRRQDGNTD